MALAGAWVVDRSDKRALAELGDVLLEFSTDGSLTYVVRGAEKNQIINLTYRVDGNMIVTDQPSAPREERTAFELSDAGILTLAFGGVPYRFQKYNPEEPS
jgi:hypothetical protein